MPRIGRSSLQSSDTRARGGDLFARCRLGAFSRYRPNGGASQRLSTASLRSHPCDTFYPSSHSRLEWGWEAGSLPNISIFNTGPTACRLRANVTFSIRDGSGKLLPIRGNPARLTLKANSLRRTGRPAHVSWWWGNRCGRDKPPFIYEGRIGQLAVRFFETVPRRAARAEPPTLSTCSWRARSRRTPCWSPRGCAGPRAHACRD